MKTDQQRIAHYNNRMLSTIVDPVLAAVYLMASTNFATYATDFYTKQLALRTILSDLPIPTPQYAGYEAYAGELYHLSKVCTGVGLAANATILKIKWASAPFLGAAAKTTLVKIAFDLYGIVIVP
jgi:hypothetical protein